MLDTDSTLVDISVATSNYPQEALYEQAMVENVEVQGLDLQLLEATYGNNQRPGSKHSHDIQTNMTMLERELPQRNSRYIISIQIAK